MGTRTMRGKAWVFEGILDVDWEICPFGVQSELREKGIPITDAELGKYCMTKLDPDFPRKVGKGDFIVAGDNVGYGHDHYHACRSIKGAGVAAVVCESSNAIFFRNSVECGLPVVECKGVKEAVSQGDDLEVDLLGGTVRNLTTGQQLSFTPYPSFLLEMVEANGIYPLLKKKLAAQASSAPR